MTQSEPSQAAVDEAALVIERMESKFPELTIARATLAAAHDPSLKLDRSVRLGDVVQALCGSGAFNCGSHQGYEYPHELVIGTFGSGDDDSPG